MSQRYNCNFKLSRKIENNFHFAIKIYFIPANCALMRSAHGECAIRMKM